MKIDYEKMISDWSIGTTADEMRERYDMTRAQITAFATFFGRLLPRTLIDRVASIKPADTAVDILDKMRGR